MSRLQAAFLRGKRAMPTRCHGVSLVELLIALSISAALLTATGAAINASFTAYQVNQEQSTLTQRARLALNRMLSTIRTTREHSPVTVTQINQFKAGSLVTDSGIQMYDETGAIAQFKLNTTSHQLLAIQAGTSHVLLNGVTQFQVQMQPMKSATAVKTGGVYDLLKRATILLTVETNSSTSTSSETNNSQKVTMSCSVTPRQNLW